MEIKGKIIGIIILFIICLIFVFAVVPADRVVLRNDLSVVKIANLNGSLSGGMFGDSLFEAADFNNDSYMDLAIGADGFNLNYGARDFTGQLYIFYGSAAGWGSLSVTEANVTINGTSPGRFGSILLAEDFNNDSLVDLAVAAYEQNLSRGALDYYGQVYVFYSSADGLQSGTANDANVTLNATSPSRFGLSMVAGDFNNDSLKDLAVGADYKTLNGGAADYTGQAYIFYGSTDGLKSYTTAEANVTFNGSAVGDFGYYIGKDDFNQDNLTDLIISAPWVNPSGGAYNSVGQVYIYYGGQDGFTGLTANDANVTFNGTAVAGLFGGAFVTDDWNNDGYKDILVSSFGKNVSGGALDYTGQLYLFYGASGGISGHPAEMANVTINGTSPSYLGIYLESYDVNRDNYKDLAVSAYAINLSGGALDYTGQVYIFYGTQDGLKPYTGYEANITLNGTNIDYCFGLFFKFVDLYNDSISEFIVTELSANISGGVSDNFGVVHIYSFNFAPLNHTAIPAQSWNEDSSITINLSLYFNDTESEELNYTWTDANDITESINEVTNIVTLTPTGDWYGTRYITFYANDSYNNLVSSNNITLTVANVADCGDGTCESGETCSSCQADCGSCPETVGGDTQGTVQVAEPKAVDTVSEMAANTATEFDLGTKTAVSQVILTVNKELSNVQIQVKEIDEEKVSEAPDDVYRYLQITSSNLENKDISEAVISFDVEKSWLENQAINKENIILMKYVTRWEELTTSFEKEDENKYYYSAETNGFSNFAISYKEKAVTEEVKAEIIEEVQEEIKEEIVEKPAESEKSRPLSYLLIILVLIILAVTIFFVIRYKKSK